MANVDDDLRARLTARAMAALAAKKIEYNQRNWEQLSRLLLDLHGRQAAGAESLSAADALEASGLSVGKLTGYLRNLAVAGIVEGSGKGEPGGLPNASYRLHVAELVAGEGDAAVPPQTVAPSRASGRRARSSASKPVSEPAAPAAAPARRRQPGELSPELFANGYLSAHAEARDQYRRELKLLSDWLDAHPDAPEPPVHANERSYEIFNDEKFLGNEKARRLLRAMGMGDERLGISSTRSGYLFATAPHPARKPTFLLVENHAAYDSLVHLLVSRRAPLMLLGERIDGVLHSNGSAVNSLSRVEEYIESFGYADFTMLYWGDIDRSGVSELDAALATASRPIRPFTALYELCVHRQIERVRAGFPIEAAGDAARECDVERFACLFSGFDADAVRIVLLGALRVPQEIVSRADLEELLPPVRRVSLPGRRLLGGAARAAGLVAGLLGGVAGMAPERALGAAPAAAPAADREGSDD